LARAGIAGDVVDEVLMGCVLASGQGQNVARQSAVAAGLPASIPATTINNVCGSGLKTVNPGRVADPQRWKPISSSPAAWRTCRPRRFFSTRRDYGYRMGHGFARRQYDQGTASGTFSAITHMGVTAENVAEKYGISREDQDAFALAANQR